MKRLGWIAAAALASGCSFHAKNIQPTAPYDFTALTQMAKYAQAAYTDTLTIATVVVPAFNDFTVKRIPATNNQYFIATSSATRTQLIAIAGTANLENVLVDADFTQLASSGTLPPLHRGFARAARLIYDDVKPRLKPGYRVQLTGHSLGGAEAVILAMLLQAAGTPAERIVTFGQPKVTTQAGAYAFEGLPLIRIVNLDDVVPALPLAPYRHIGAEVVIFTGATYSVITARPLSPAAVAAAWEALRNHRAPAELPQHAIANYLVNLESKTSASERIPYPKR